MFELFSTADAWISLATLTLMEIVLGIDNVVFISIVAGRLQGKEQKTARALGIFLALFIRIILLMTISWIIGLTTPVFTILENEISWRDLILIAGGLFLIAKSTKEIHHRIEYGDEHPKEAGKRISFRSVVTQIALIDVVFSFDSIITAVGLVDEVVIMVLAVVISMIIMFSFSGPVSRFIDRNPTMKMLALSFLIMIGFTLIVEALAFHIPKGYVYSAMAFSLLVESLNIRLRNRDQKRRGELNKSR